VYCRRSTAAVVPLDRHHWRLPALFGTGDVDAVSVDTRPARVVLDRDATVGTVDSARSASVGD
jgi:hypothetical protein